MVTGEGGETVVERALSRVVPDTGSWPEAVNEAGGAMASGSMLKLLPADSVGFKDGRELVVAKATDRRSSDSIVDEEGTLEVEVFSTSTSEDIKAVVDDGVYEWVLIVLDKGVSDDSKDAVKDNGLTMVGCNSDEGAVVDLVLNAEDSIVTEELTSLVDDTPNAVDVIFIVRKADLSRL